MYLDKFFCAIIHFMVPLDVGHDAGHVHLALEGGRLAGLCCHIVHDVLNVGLAARPNWKK
jgi:hypothetical protein